jgi:hypothetical protein
MASKESTTQPIICCLGQSVAGQPTQFLLDRAFAALRLQWQALSVEVRPEKLALVCEATIEMGFHGLRFYEAIASIACPHLANPSSLERFVGFSSSAISQKDRWQVWDSLGYGWIDLLKQNQVDALWLHGDSRTTRSLFAALATSNLKWVWTEAPASLLTDEVDLPDLIRGQVPVRAFADNVTHSKPIQELLGCSLQPTGDNIETLVSRLAIVTEQNQLPEAKLPEAHHAEALANQIALMNVQLITPSNLRLPDSLAALRCVQLSQADVAVAAELYDFQRWTGKTIDVSILRDAYDEYCDF